MSDSHKETPSEKILNNKYNTGELDFDYFGDFSVSDTWVKGDHDVEIHEKYEMEILEKEINEIFKNSPFFEKYSNSKKVKRDDIVYVFYYILDRIKTPERFSAIEKFLSIAGFMNMNFKNLYNAIDLAYKEKILNEFNSKYGIFEKKNLKKLF